MLWAITEVVARAKSEGVSTRLKVRGMRTMEELLRLPRGRRAGALCEAQALDVESDEPTGVDKLRTGEQVAAALIIDGDKSRTVAVSRSAVAYSIDGGVAEVEIVYTVETHAAAAWLALRVGEEVDIVTVSEQAELAL